MEKIDVELKNFLGRERRKGVSRLSEIPSDEEFYLFVTDRLRGAALERMFAHLARTPEDQKLVAEARSLLAAGGEAGMGSAPRASVAKAKALMGRLPEALCPHCGKSITPFKKPPASQARTSSLWLAAAAAAFALSFVFRHYFFQYLVAAVLLGVKGIVEARAAKTQILIYKALKDDPSDRLSGLHKPADHL